MNNIVFYEVGIVLITDKKKAPEGLLNMANQKLAAVCVTT